MPGLNGTGPMGAGPMTGGGFGRCGGGVGRGMGGGRRFAGGGWGGRGGRFQAVPVTGATPADSRWAGGEADVLNRINSALSAIEERLSRLEKERG